MSRGDFLRQPSLSPTFFTHGLKLISPGRSLVSTTADTFSIELENPQKTWLMGFNGESKCAVTPTRVTCPRGQLGKNKLMLFAGRQRYGEYEYIGHFEVQRE